MRSNRTAILAAALLVFGTGSAARGQNGDDSGIRALETAQEAAWNAHDAHAYAMLFAPDADLVNVLGWWWKGRDEVEAKLRAAFSYVFAESALHIDSVESRALAPDLALVHVAWSMTGARSPDGSGGNIPQHGIQTQVLRRTEGRWLIVAFQNTNTVPERTFPIAAPPPAPKPKPRRCLLGNSSGKCLIGGGATP